MLDLCRPNVDCAPTKDQIATFFFVLLFGGFLPTMVACSCASGVETTYLSTSRTFLVSIVLFVPKDGSSFTSSFSLFSDLISLAESSKAKGRFLRDPILSCHRF